MLIKLHKFQIKNSKTIVFFIYFFSVLLNHRMLLGNSRKLFGSFGLLKIKTNEANGTRSERCDA